VSEQVDAAVIEWIGKAMSGTIHREHAVGAG
jgi:hypothetical protein